MVGNFQRIHPGDLAESRTQDAGICWAVVAQNAKGASYLFFVDLCATDTGQLVFEKIRKEYSRVTASTCKDSWISKSFTKVVMGSAEVQWVHNYVFTLLEESD